MTPIGTVFAVWTPANAQRERWRSDLQNHFDTVEDLSGWIVGTGHVGGVGPARVDGRCLALDLTVASVDELSDWMSSEAHASSFGQLPGDVTAVSFAPGRCSAWRSVSGRVPVLWADTGDLLVVTTQLGLYRELVTDDVDPLGLAAWVWASQALPDDRTPVSGLSAVPAGGYVHLAEGKRPRMGRYWRLTDVETAARPSRRAVEAHAEAFRVGLFDALRSDTGSSGTLLSLSGGVDSSALAAVLVNVLGREVDAFSVLPAEPTDRDAQRKFLLSLRESVEFRSHHEARYDELGWFDAAAVWAGHGISIPHAVLAHLPELAELTGATVLVGGEFGDPVVGWQSGFDDWLRAVSPWALMSRFRAPRLLPASRRAVARAVIRRSRRSYTPDLLPGVPDQLPGFFRREIREEYREWRRRCEAEVAAIGHGPRSLYSALLANGSILQNWEAATMCGMRRSYPFLARAVLEASASCHPDELIGQGSKGLLRRSLRGVVPEPNLLRRDKGMWAGSAPTHFPRDLVLPPIAATVVRNEHLHAAAGELDMGEALARSEVGTALDGEWVSGACEPPMVRVFV